ncbi:unnamed protein product [Phytophthora fragariaefolia]|uniref:Unnamed protein product n=1 Tax=Phytophthora fragariaefolia TaxID=1490495 RepID=A0A9W6YFT2_9STRA|nr:unnamed protein product [Phytophthora fragariaefolia]GMF80219.1 unnamed protein product [Phytophthora fragariaefolia]
MGSPLVLSINEMEDATAPVISCGNHELSPTGIDDFTPYSFTAPVNRNGFQYNEMKENSCVGDNVDCMPIGSYSSEKQRWSDADLEFLQSVLLAWLSICTVEYYEFCSSR